MVLELLQYGFMQRALLGGIAIAIVCSLIGTHLVLRRLSLLGDGLAHVAFGGVALGMLLGIEPIIAALVATALAALGIHKMIRKTHVYGDAAIGFVFSMGIGIALIIIGAVNGFNVNLFSFLFGSILTLSRFDLVVIGLVLVAVVLFTLLHYRKLLFMSFNEDIAKLSGIKVNVVTNLFAIFTALAVVVTIRAVGVLLVSALLVIPVITALELSRSFKKTMMVASLVSSLSVIVGIVLAFYLDLPPAGTIVVFIGALFLVVLGVKRGVLK